MKKVLFLSSLIILNIVVKSQIVVYDNDEFNKTRQIQTNTIELGEVTSIVVDYIFIQNNYLLDLKIKNIITPNEISIESFPKTIKPNSIEKIKYKFNPSTLPAGRFEKNIILIGEYETLDQTKPVEIKYFLQGIVKK